MSTDPGWLRRFEAAGMHPVGEPVRADPGHVGPVPKSRPKGRPLVMPGKRAFVELPVPPSANNLYANVPGKGRVKTQVYRQWQEIAVIFLTGLSVPPYPLSLRYTVLAGVGWSERRDLGNAEKALTDLLVYAELIIDDCTKYVRGSHIDYDPELRGPKTAAVVRVEVRSWAAGG